MKDAATRMRASIRRDNIAHIFEAPSWIHRDPGPREADDFGDDAGLYDRARPLLLMAALFCAAVFVFLLIAHALLPKVN